MDQQREDAMRRLKKLLQFNEDNCTPEEFALAGTRIKTILEKYQLSISDVNIGTTTELVGESSVVLNKKTISGWQKYLAYRISCTFDCKLFICPVGVSIFRGPLNNKLIFIGMKSDVEVCKYFYDMCSTQLLAIAKRRGRAKGYEGRRIVTYTNSFMMGAASIIGERLSTKYVSDQPVQANALVVIKDKAIKEYMSTQNVVRSKTTQTNYKDEEGLFDGAAEASRFGLNRGINSRSESVLSLGRS